MSNMEEISEEDAGKYASVLAEVLILEPLDQDQSPDNIDKENYDSGIRPIAESVVGLPHPDEYELFEYPSGEQLVHDLLDKSLEDEDFEDLDEESQDENAGSEINLFQLGEAFERFSKALPALTETTENPLNISYVPDNIQEAADESGIHPGIIKYGSLMEEAVHAIQAHNYPEIFERKEDLAGNLSSSENKEELLALMSAIEGHARFYVDKAMSGYELFEEDIELGEDPVLEVLEVDGIVDQYNKGLEFVSELYESEGIGAVDQVLEQPPESMEEVENPGRYLERVYGPDGI